MTTWRNRGRALGLALAAILLTAALKLGFFSGGGDKGGGFYTALNKKSGVSSAASRTSEKERAPRSVAEGLTFRGRAGKLDDGDSFELLREDSPAIVKIRIYGIDAPEKGQPYAEKARDHLSRLIRGKKLIVRVHDVDKYDRYVGEVFLPDGRNVNEEMVRAGLAWCYQRYAPAEENLKALEAQARAQRRGLWAGMNPVPPWDWRHHNYSAGTHVPESGFCASRNSTVYHPCSCPSVSTINPQNLIWFTTQKEARKSGRRHCRCPPK